MATKRLRNKIIKAKKEEVPTVESRGEQVTSFFPRIFRFITEHWKLISVSFVSGLILIAIGLQAFSLYTNIQKENKAKYEHQKTLSELSYWKSALGKYQDSRDVYYKIATIEYRLGNIDESRVYLRKALQIDPNFEQGYVLGAKVGL